MHEIIEKTWFYKIVSLLLVTNGISSKLKMHENIEKNTIL